MDNKEKIKRFLRKNVFPILFSSFITFFITLFFLTPILEPLASPVWKFMGYEKKASILIDINRNEPLEENFDTRISSSEYFFGIEWKEEYQIYEITIKNSSDLPLENIDLKIDFPIFIINEYIQSTGVDFSIIQWPPIYLGVDVPEDVLKDLSMPSNIFPAKFIPRRQIHIDKLSSGMSVAILVLIDGSDSAKNIFNWAISDLEEAGYDLDIQPGTYICQYEWESRSGRHIKRIEDTFEIKS